MARCVGVLTPVLVDRLSRKLTSAPAASVRSDHRGAGRATSRKSSKDNHSDDDLEDTTETSRRSQHGRHEGAASGSDSDSDSDAAGRQSRADDGPSARARLALRDVDSLLDVIFELRTAGPGALLALLPLVCRELSVAEAGPRLRAATLLGQLFASTDSEPPLAMQYRKQFLEFLGRLRDKETSVRLAVTELAGEILLQHATVLDDVVPALSERLSDPEPAVRLKAVKAACDACAARPTQPLHELIRAVGERARDRRPEVRKEALTGLAQVFGSAIPSLWAGADENGRGAMVSLVDLYGSAQARASETDTAVIAALWWVPDALLRAFGDSRERSVRLRIVQLLDHVMLNEGLPPASRALGVLHVWACMSEQGRDAWIQLMEHRATVQRMLGELLSVRRRVLQLSAETARSKAAAIAPRPAGPSAETSSRRVRGRGPSNDATGPDASSDTVDEESSGSDAAPRSTGSASAASSELRAAEQALRDIATRLARATSAMDDTAACEISILRLGQHRDEAVFRALAVCADASHSSADADRAKADVLERIKAVKGPGGEPIAASVKSLLRWTCMTGIHSDMIPFLVSMTDAACKDLADIERGDPDYEDDPFALRRPTEREGDLIDEAHRLAASPRQSGSRGAGPDIWRGVDLAASLLVRVARVLPAALCPHRLRLAQLGTTVHRPVAVAALAALATVLSTPATPLSSPDFSRLLHCLARIARRPDAELSAAAVTALAHLTRGSPASPDSDAARTCLKGILQQAARVLRTNSLADAVTTDLRSQPLEALQGPSDGHKAARTKVRTSPSGAGATSSRRNMSERKSHEESDDESGDDDGDEDEDDDGSDVGCTARLCVALHRFAAGLRTSFDVILEIGEGLSVLDESSAVSLATRTVLLASVPDPSASSPTQGTAEHGPRARVKRDRPSSDHVPSSGSLPSSNADASVVTACRAATCILLSASAAAAMAACRLEGPSSASVRYDRARAAQAAESVAATMTRILVSGGALPLIATPDEGGARRPTPSSADASELRRAAATALLEVASLPSGAMTVKPRRLQLLAALATSSVEPDVVTRHRVVRLACESLVTSAATIPLRLLAIPVVAASDSGAHPTTRTLATQGLSRAVAAARRVYTARAAAAVHSGSDSHALAAVAARFLPEYTALAVMHTLAHLPQFPAESAWRPALEGAAGAVDFEQLMRPTYDSLETLITAVIRSSEDARGTLMRLVDAAHKFPDVQDPSSHSLQLVLITALKLLTIGIKSTRDVSSSAQIVLPTDMFAVTTRAERPAATNATGARPATTSRGPQLDSKLAGVASAAAAVIASKMRASAE